MFNPTIGAWITVISHKRPQNVPLIQDLIGGATFYVNIGESQDYMKGSLPPSVVECGTNICEARNRAIDDAMSKGLPCIQVSDDLRGIKLISMVDGKHHLEPITFEDACHIILGELTRKGYIYGGVAVSNNRLNYSGEDFSYDKLIVNDLICVMPGDIMFDENLALKEDYDFTIQNLLDYGGVVRCNNLLCDFPHRENTGGANTYRNSETEDAATKKLIAKRGEMIKPHATRPGQISLNYAVIRKIASGQNTIF